MAAMQPATRQRVQVVRNRPFKARLDSISSRFHWFLEMAPEHLENMTPELAQLGTIEAIENGTNDFVVMLVAASGFFTDSYILFATNAILPMLDYVYWGSSTAPSHETAINCTTLAGVFCGMVSFGYLADKFGRQKLYGIVLLVLIGGTLGLVMSSRGYMSVDTTSGSTKSSMNMLACLLFWRFVSGVGIGGDYPLSAIMVSELAPTSRRAYMLAILFSMQAFGYATATITSIVVVSVVRHYHPEPSQVSVDQIWRWVMGLSLIPASIAVLMRCFVPESPRYTLYVLNYPFRALQEADTLNQANIQHKYQQKYADGAIQSFMADGQQDQASLTQRQEFEIHDPVRRRRNAITIRKFWQYLCSGINTRKLLVTSSTWFLLDFTFFGLGFSAPQTMAKVWEGSYSFVGQPPPRLWDTDYGDKNPNIYSILLTDNVRSLITSSIGAIVGALILIFTIERWNRKRLQYVGFGVLTILFIIIGGSYQATIDSYRGVTITLYAFTQLCFSFGPNALTFIVAAEIFGTRFRCTCHGLSAAAGKLGSIVAQIVLAYSLPPCQGGGHCHIDSPQSTWLKYLLVIFAAPMAFGCFITWKWLPELQESDGPRRYDNIPLEDLGEEHREVRRPKATPQGQHEA